MLRACVSAAATAAGGRASGGRIQTFLTNQSTVFIFVGLIACCLDFNMENRAHGN